MKSKFTLYHMPKSFCNECHERVYLLGVAEYGDRPSFFICFKCGLVWQVGVGPVELVKEGK